MYLGCNHHNHNGSYPPPGGGCSSDRMIRLLSFASFVACTWVLSVYADERPSGVPSEARWVKVDRVTDSDTIVLMDRTRVRLHYMA